MKAVLRSLLIAGGFTLAATVANAQMKIGDNPSQITRSAILELNSTRQGLLLPRLTDTAAINTLIGTDPVDGMLIYLTTATVPANNGVYLRKASHWQRVASAADAMANWSLTGNAGTSPITNYVGTSDAVPFSLRSNATEGISIQTDGKVQLKQVAASSTLVDVLVIDQTNGTVSRRAVPASSFKTMSLDVDSSHINMNLDITTDPTEAVLNVPILAASNPTGTQYGLLTKKDWDKLQALYAGNNFTIADFVTAVATGDENKAGQISYDAVTAAYTLRLVAASKTLAGIVTTTTQTFGGDKTFAGNVKVEGTTELDGAATLGSTLAVTGATTLSNTLQVAGATTLDSMLVLNSVTPVATNGHLDVLVRDGATHKVVSRDFNMDALQNAINLIKAGGQYTKGAEVSFVTGTDSTDFHIKADSVTKSITFNLPDASGTDALHTVNQRGVVNTYSQSFAGTKAFTGKVSVGGLDTLSTLSVTGSVSMSIDTKTAAYTLTAADNTILANTNGGAFTVTLPTAVKGRLYTIKKIGGDIDNPLTVATTSGQTIEGGTNYMIYNDWTFITVQSDGTAWFIVRR